MHDETAETLPGTQSSHEEPQPGVTGEPHGGGWRRLDPPIAVRAFLADTWVVVVTDAVNDDTGEVRVLWPLADSRGLGEVYHRVLDRSHYQTPAGRLGT